MVKSIGCEVFKVELKNQRFLPKINTAKNFFFLSGNGGKNRKCSLNASNELNTIEEDLKRQEDFKISC